MFGRSSNLKALLKCQTVDTMPPCRRSPLFLDKLIRNIVIVIVVVFVIVIIVVVTRPGILPRWAKFRAWLFKLSGQLEDMYILCRHLVMPGQSVISFWFIFFMTSCSGNMFVQASGHVQAVLFDKRNIVIVSTSYTLTP